MSNYVPCLENWWRWRGKKINFKIDYQLSLDVEQWFRMMIQKSRELAIMLEKNGHRKPSEIIKRVDYVIIGTTAFPIHGFSRATLDIFSSSFFPPRKRKILIYCWRSRKRLYIPTCLPIPVFTVYPVITSSIPTAAKLFLQCYVITFILFGIKVRVGTT